MNRIDFEHRSGSGTRITKYNSLYGECHTYRCDYDASTAPSSLAIESRVAFLTRAGTAIRVSDQEGEQAAGQNRKNKPLI